ncbi:hypothetical protein ACFLZZ_00355 [Nanoarchaeota archaeon]
MKKKAKNKKEKIPKLKKGDFGYEIIQELIKNGIKEVEEECCSHKH